MEKKTIRIGILAIFAILILALPAFSQKKSFVENQNFLSFPDSAKASGKLGLNISVEKGLKGGFSLIGWGKITEDWAETYLGPKYTIGLFKRELLLSGGIAIGIETNKKPLRGAIIASGLVKDRLFIQYVHEAGGSGPWNQFLMKMEVGLLPMNAGLLYEKNTGLGPRVEYCFKYNISVWAAYFPHTPGGKSGYISVRFSF